MVFSAVLQRFVDEAPCCVMVRGLLESIFSPPKLDAVFENHANHQYTRELLFSTVTDIMCQVVCRIQPSVHAAYKHLRQYEQIAVSVKALHDKLAHVEPDTMRGLVQHTATAVAAVLQHLGDPPASALPGYEVRIVDGNHLEGTEHRLASLRDVSGGALPGVVLAVLNPQAQLIEDVVVSEDGHAQECTLLDPILEAVRPRHVWLSDRHFCTSAWLFGLVRRQAFFVARQHGGHLRWRRLGRRRYCGRSATGKVYEQAVLLTDPQTQEEVQVRRLTIALDQPTRDGEWEIHLLSNVPAEDASALQLADLYRKRWSLETAFQDLTVHLCCELNTLGYPPAALFGFCTAVACYNVLAALKGALRAAHGEATADNLSTYYVTDEISATARGMAIAVPAADWEPFRRASPRQLAGLLKQIAAGLDVSHYRKHKQTPKQKRKPRPKAPRQHVSTWRLLHPERFASNAARGRATFK